MVDRFLTHIAFLGNNVSYSTFNTIGIPHVIVARGAKGLSIGSSFCMNNNSSGNPAGGDIRCMLFVDNGAEIIIGSNVGISQSMLISHCLIRIGDNVKIGAESRIYTTDFHSLNPAIRKTDNNNEMRVTKPVIIEDNVFIGACSIILKGVTIGENSIIGAGSIVTRDIPKNQIWAGNPARFIRSL